jgi:cytochrome c biogenesis protein CcdA/thiol-disulfide isomerase/thioredoxin
VVVAIGLAFAAGVITAVSPCVLPVLPIVFSGGATGSGRRPYAIIAGLATCFLVSILFASWVLKQLHLPQDLLRNLSIALLFLLAATLIFPQLGVLIERPLSRLSRRPSGDLGGGFLLGCALGFVFVPCGGPAIAFVTSSAATLDFGTKTFAVAISYTIGASAVLLAVAMGGRRTAGRLRTGMERLRPVFGAVLAAAALALVFNADTKLQTAVPNWTNFLQRHTESSATGDRAFRNGQNVTERRPAASNATPVTNRSSLPDYGPAPQFAGIQQWLNTPGDRPLTLAGLRGRVVLIDFWTYSCINCIRTLPHLEAWDRAYRNDGLTIVGVHTPEFAFEHVVSNVKKAIHDFGIRYPVAIDNDYGTWNAWGNNAWPAEYLIDRSGHVRSYKAGEGDYDGSEREIRQLLAEGGPTPTGRLVAGPDMTPTELTTPESYLGYERLDRFAGPDRIVPGAASTYRFPSSLAQDDLAYSGRWRVQGQRIVALRNARLRLHFHAKNVYLVLGGKGTAQVLVDGRPVKTDRVTGIPRLHTLLSYPAVHDAVLELRFSPGVAGYAFTFG